MKNFKSILEVNLGDLGVIFNKVIDHKSEVG